MFEKSSVHTPTRDSGAMVFHERSCARAPSRRASRTRTTHSEPSLPCRCSSSLTCVSSASPAGHSSVRREVGQHGGQIQMMVGDMEQQNPLRVQLPQIEGQCFAGEQMHGNGIGAKGVDHQQVETAVRLFHQLEPASPSTMSIRACDSARKVK